MLYIIETLLYCRLKNGCCRFLFSSSVEEFVKEIPPLLNILQVFSKCLGHVVLNISSFLHLWLCCLSLWTPEMFFSVMRWKIMWHTAVSQSSPVPRGLHVPNIFTHTFHNSNHRGPNRQRTAHWVFKWGLTFLYIPIQTATQKATTMKKNYSHNFLTC